jgi:hypothetical protein
MGTQIDQPFRFLEFPADLRLMVYDHLGIITRNYTLKQFWGRKDNDYGRYKTAGDLTLIVRPLNLSILATCRALNSEGTPIRSRRFAQLRTELLRLII